MAVQRKLERDRMAMLRPQAFVAQADLDLAETNYRDAEAQVEVVSAQVDHAQATRSSAELDLGFRTIYSPVNGIVVSRNVDVGPTVAASFQTPALFVIAQDLTQMQADANVSEAAIGGGAEGKPANFRVDAYPKQFFEGTVTQVRNAPISIQNVVTDDVVITVDNRELKPGMTANVTNVTAKKENPLRVPNGALRFRMPGVPVDRKVTQVWVMDQAKQARQVVIADALFPEISEGTLKEGDTVITSHQAPFSGKRIVRRREEDCAAYYRFREVMPLEATSPGAYYSSPALGAHRNCSCRNWPSKLRKNYLGSTNVWSRQS